MSCDCDDPVHPLPLAIRPGQIRLARQIATFPQFRAAMLRAAGSERYAAALGSWQATGERDLGVMLLELWAYVADVVAFYDEVHAHEIYLRTARREGSVRDLVARLGVQPRPAVSARVELALRADGRTPLLIPAGTAFRSAAFGDEPPQVFEIDADVEIHPLRSSWTVEAPRPVAVDDPGGPGATTAVLRLDPARSAKWAEGDLVLVQPDPAVRYARTVTAAEPVTDPNGERWVEVELDLTVALGAGRPLAGVRLLRPTKRATLWTGSTSVAVREFPSSPTELTLDGVYRDLRPGTLVLVRCTAPGREGLRWFAVASWVEVTTDVLVATDVYAKIPATRITLDRDLDDPTRGSTADWDPVHAPHLEVHYGLRDAGRLGAPAQPELGSSAPVRFVDAPVPRDDTATTRFVLRDVDGVAVGGHGEVDFAARTLDLSATDTPRPPLGLPVTAYGNLVEATRGETVANEVLGSGDASRADQTFRLHAGPLAFVPSAATTEGYATTLRVWVDGRQWTEVTSFYGVGRDARVYRVTLDAEGAATVTFGDGVRGARLPTGVDNVVASYRKGAGAAAPPAGSIRQIARSVAGLRSVVQPFAAWGGADAEDPAQVRTLAPRQALTLGRAVSIRDFEAFAQACAGVRAVSVGWEWDSRFQRPVVKVWVVGEGDVAATVRARLLAVSDPTTPIAVAAATPLPVDLAVTTTRDPTVAGDVGAAVAAALLDPPSGLLRVETSGIGEPVYFSTLFAAIHAVPGVVSSSLQWSRGGAVVTDYGDLPDPGTFFDLSGGILVDGQGYAGG